METRRYCAYEKAALVLLGYLIIFVAVGIVTLQKYGLTWDEGLGNLFFGERYFHFFISLDSAYLDFARADLDIHTRSLNLFGSPFRGNPNEFPPLADTVSAASMELFAYRLGWLDPIDAFHLPKILLCALLLWAMFNFARSRLGTLTAWLTILFLSTHPRFWGDMHFNPKDIPETVFFPLGVIAFVAWYEKPSWQRAVGVGTLFGASLSIKANALFLPAILILGVWPWQLTMQPWQQVKTHLEKYLGHYYLMIGSAVSVHLVIWPYLYADPFRLTEYYTYILSQGGRQGSATWNWDPLIQVATTMPEVMLLFSLVGLGLAIWRGYTCRSTILRLIAAWVSLPILRSSFPGIVNFDGIRHFEEFLPAASLLAGYGSASLVENLANRQPLRKLLWTTGLVLLVILNIGGIVLRYDPYEHLYYNSLIGGLSGAHYRYAFPEATDYWGSSYREGMIWLNANAPPGSVLYTPIAEWVVRLTAPIWLRKDFRVEEATSLKSALESERPVYVMFITRTGWYNAIAKYCTKKLQPVHEIVVDGTPILKIYRLTDADELPE